MFTIRKLRPDRSIEGAVPALLMAVAFAATALVFGIRAGCTVGAVLLLAYALFWLNAYRRTRSLAYLISTLYCACMAAAMAVAPATLLTGRRVPAYGIAVLAGAFWGVWLIHLTVNRQAKWRGREILELAAQPVEEVGNGYTSRPLPVGRVDVSRDHLLAFADFAGRNMIALPYVDGERVVLVLVRMGQEFRQLLRRQPDAEQDTWVSLGFDGQVVAHISHDDYLEFRQGWSFEQLCDSLGNLFVDFLEQFRRGEGRRVIDRMDALEIGVLS